MTACTPGRISHAAVLLLALPFECISLQAPRSQECRALAPPPSTHGFAGPLCLSAGISNKLLPQFLSEQIDAERKTGHKPSATSSLRPFRHCASTWEEQSQATDNGGPTRLS